MFELLKRRPYRIILTANFISLIGSGLNHASIIWFVLQKTHSEQAVALLVTAITLPSLFFLPFSGVLIDRLDRRYVSMTLDICRGTSVAIVAALAFMGRAEVWHIYAMGIALGLGAFMFWPNMQALTQEMAEHSDVVPLNALVQGSAQAGWMISGAIVGFLYRRIGLGGTLSMDAASYAFSVFLMFRVRKGKHLVHNERTPLNLGRFNRDFVGGLRYAASNARVMILGIVAALFTAAMMSQNVLTAPFSDKILKAGPEGFGYCAAGWSLGAIFISVVAGTVLSKSSARLWVLSGALVLAGVACVVLPHFAILIVGVAGYVVMGAGRGMAGVGINSVLMHEVPRQLMGRTQNVINFTAIVMQLVLTMACGWLSEHLAIKYGFYAVGSFYFTGGLLAMLVARMPESGARLLAPDAPPPETLDILMPEVEAAEL